MVPIHPTNQMLADIRDAFGPLTSRPRGGGYDTLAEIQRDIERDFRLHAEKWERNAPRRHAAEAAQWRADIIRRHELGLDDAGRVPVAAALDWAEPTRPRVF